MSTFRKTPIEFEHSALYNKAKLYIKKYTDTQKNYDSHEHSAFLWLSLSLEFLLKSALSKIDPVLLAETQNNNDDNILANFVLHN